MEIITPENLGENVSRRRLLRLSWFGLLGAFISPAFSPRSSHAQTKKSVLNMRIHGHSVQIEDPDSIKSVERKRFHTRVVGKEGSQNWFHFAIPTPIIVNGEQLRAESINLRFKTESKGALVKHIQVFDGESRIAAFMSVDLSGEDIVKEFKVPGYPCVEWGLGISIAVVFRKKAPIEFLSAGCNFIA